MRTLAFVVLLAATGLGACGSRAHLSPSFGRANRQAFERQAIDPYAGYRHQSVGGLDSQEAAIVATTHRRNLTPKGTATPADEPLIIVAPNQQQGLGSARQLSPSVPPSSEYPR
jgi:hypothetical protein